MTDRFCCDGRCSQGRDCPGRQAMNDAVCGYAPLVLTTAQEASIISLCGNVPFEYVVNDQLPPTYGPHAFIPVALPKVDRPLRAKVFRWGLAAIGAFYLGVAVLLLRSCA